MHSIAYRLLLQTHIALLLIDSGKEASKENKN